MCAIIKYLSILSILFLCTISEKTFRHLSRRRRYLVFPKGSSLQLVYCLTSPIQSVSSAARVKIGFTMGLAWPLPYHASQLELLDDWRPVKSHLSSRFEYDDLESSQPANSWSKIPHSPWYQHNYSYAKQERLHRHHRRDLYYRLESFLEPLGGKACILRALCEAGQRYSGRGNGSFLQELLQVLFKYPPQKNYENSPIAVQREVPDWYDAAHAMQGECNTTFSECRKSLFEMFTK